VALAIGFSTLEVYQLGAKFVGAVANYARLAQEYAAAQQPPHKPAPPEMKNEPGVVPVMIIPKKEQNKN
jgi:hypothetical protein